MRRLPCLYSAHPAGPQGDIVSPGSSLGSPPGGTSPELFTQEASRGHEEKVSSPPQLTPLYAEEQGLYSEFLPGD